MTFSRRPYPRMNRGRVRRKVGSGFSPASLNAISGIRVNLWSHLDVTDASGKASAWGDQSTEGNDVSQGTASARPVIVSDELNGYQVLRFTDADSTYIGRSSLVSGARSNISCVAIVYRMRNTTLADNEVLTGAGDATNSHAVYYSSADTGTLRMFSGTQLVGDDTLHTIETASWHLAFAQFRNDASAKLYIDGTLLEEASVGTDAGDGINIGANNSPARFADADIAHVSVYDADLVGTDAFSLIHDNIPEFYSL